MLPNIQFHPREYKNTETTIEQNTSSNKKHPLKTLGHKIKEPPGDTVHFKCKSLNFSRID